MTVSSKVKNGKRNQWSIQDYAKQGCPLMGKWKGEIADFLQKLMDSRGEIFLKKYMMQVYTGPTD